MSDNEMVTVPLEPPDSIPDGYDEILFDLCWDDDYRGLYRELLKRALTGKPATRINQDASGANV